MPAVSTMILRSMRMIGEKARGETLSSDEATECLAELNSMMDSWSVDRTKVYQLKQESFPLSSNTIAYTIGTGATFNTDRPTKIVDPCFIRDTSNLDSYLTVVNDETYGSIVQKNVGVSYPTYLYYNYGFDSSGHGTISLYPAPQGSLTLFINSWKQLQNFANVSTALALPPGYQLAIESNFAVHLAAGLKPVSAEVVKIARDSMAAIKSINLPAPISKLDNATPGRRGINILTGP